MKTRIISCLRILLLNEQQNQNYRSYRTYRRLFQAGGGVGGGRVDSFWNS